MADDQKGQDKRNRTGKPIMRRDDISPKEFEEMRSDSYMVAENDSYEGGSGRGAMPTDQYPCGKVKTKVWNETRPMKRDVKTTVMSNRDHRNAMD